MSLIMKTNPFEPASVFCPIFHLADIHMKIGFARRNGDGASVGRKIHAQISIYEVTSSSQPIQEPMCHVSAGCSGGRLGLPQVARDMSRAG